MGTRKRFLVFTCSLAVLGGLAGLAVGAGSALYQLSDDELDGPVQPIEFSHALHAGEMKINCIYCHTSADKSQAASLPAVSVCWGCHQFVKEGPSAGSREEIAKIQQYMCGQGETPSALAPCKDGTSIPWVRIHLVPEHVQFKHMRHVRDGKVECQACHGPVEEMKRVWLVPDTVLRPSSAFLPAQKLEMGWCLNCHEQKGATKDCAACHY